MAEVSGKLIWGMTACILFFFALVFAGMFAYPHLRIRYYESKLLSENEKEFQGAVKTLLSLGESGVESVNKYFERDDTGWGKPSGGLVARVKPAEITLRNDTKMEMTFEILNISTGNKNVSLGDCRVWNEIIDCTEMGEEWAEAWSSMSGKTPMLILPGEIAADIFEARIESQGDCFQFWSRYASRGQGNVYKIPSSRKCTVTFQICPNSYTENIKLKSNDVKVTLDIPETGRE